MDYCLQDNIQMSKIDALSLNRVSAGVHGSKQKISVAVLSTACMGIMLCRELFYSCFGTTDQQEGMAAFLEKRPAVWKEGKKPM